MYESGEMVIFGQLFQEIAEKETRVVTPLGDSKLGRESYALVDLYCVAPDCDCRRVMINVIRDRDTKHLATVNWAFDPNDPDRGPFLDPLNVQSEVAADLIELVKEQLADRRYVERSSATIAWSRRPSPTPATPSTGSLRELRAAAREAARRSREPSRC